MVSFTIPLFFFYAEPMPWTILQHLENPFPNHSSILYWHSTLQWNGTHRILLLLGTYGTVLTRFFSMWRKPVLWIFDRWGLQVHCWKDASEFFLSFSAMIYIWLCYRFWESVSELSAQWYFVIVSWNIVPSHSLAGALNDRCLWTKWIS